MLAYKLRLSSGTSRKGGKPASGGRTQSNPVIRLQTRRCAESPPSPTVQSASGALTLYNFQLEYPKPVDQEHLGVHLTQIADSLNAMETQLQGRLNRGYTMIWNAYTECMAKIGQIRASLSALQEGSVASGQPVGDSREAGEPEAMVATERRSTEAVGVV